MKLGINILYITLVLFSIIANAEDFVTLIPNAINSHDHMFGNTSLLFCKMSKKETCDGKNNIKNEKIYLDGFLLRIIGSPFYLVYGVEQFLNDESSFSLDRTNLITLGYSEEEIQDYHEEEFKFYQLLEETLGRSDITEHQKILFSSLDTYVFHSVIANEFLAGKAEFSAEIVY